MYTNIEFEWDPLKNLENFRKHGYLFSQAVEVFDSPYVTKSVDREGLPEDRFIVIGILSGGPILTLIATVREDRVRVISARQSSKKERKTYNEKIKKII